jgi:hypothetical protein
MLCVGSVTRTGAVQTDDAQAGRKFLAREPIVLADLVAAHPEEFWQAMEAEAVLTALVKGASS